MSEAEPALATRGRGGRPPVMEKSGFSYEREITFKAERFVLYRCNAPGA